MSLFANAIAWLFDPANWSGSGGIPARLWQHIALTIFTVVISALVAIPVGIVVSRARFGPQVIGAVTGAFRAIPTLGLLTLFGLALGIGLNAPTLALMVLAIPSLLAGAYSGMQAVPAALRHAATTIGMSKGQVLRQVELPLAAPVMIGGIRSATLQVVATATLAAYISDVGLGRFLFAGLKSRDYAEMLGGAMLVTLLALVLELVLAAWQRLARLNTKQSTERMVA